MSQQKFTVLEDCPEWPLVRCIGRGHWTSADAETFENPETGQVEHLHFYMSQDKARGIWHDVKHFVPPTVKSVSFQTPRVRTVSGLG